jgi:hypothetical protein
MVDSMNKFGIVNIIIFLIRKQRTERVEAKVKIQKSRRHYHITNQRSQDDITALNGCNSISSYKRPILAAIV